MAGRSAKCKQCGSRIEIPATEPDDDDGELYLEDPSVDSSHKSQAADDGELYLEDPAGESSSKPAASDASEQDGSSSQNCPMCGSEILPDSDLCLVCGYTLGSGDEDGTPPASKEEEEERRIAELLKSPDRTIGQKIGDWSVRIVTVLVILGVVGYVGWTIKQMIAESQSHGRIEELVASGMNSTKDAPALATRLAAEIEHLPTFIQELMESAQKVAESNQNIGGLKYIDEDPPRYFLGFKGRDYDVTQRNAEDIPLPWRQTTTLATLLVNLPTDTDVTPLIQYHDKTCLPILIRVLGERTKLDWQIEQSCEGDESVRTLAAHLLLERLGASDNKAALTKLANESTIDEKKKLFEQMKANAPQ